MIAITTQERRRGILAALVSVYAALFLSAASGQQTNPLASDPRAAGAGGVIFRAQCATCHGADAKGISSIDAPDLTLMWTQPGVNDARVFARIREGVPGSIMPPHDFPDTQIWMLVSYLRSVAIAGSTREFTGDADGGERLFAAHCIECHRAGDDGGSLGPNLARITQRRTQDALRNSVRDPSAIILRGYKPIALDSRIDGEAVGLIKTEDAFSIQILDSDQRLRGYLKSQLISVDREVDSLMPAFTEQVLSDEQLMDILSYLNQQR